MNTFFIVVGFLVVWAVEVIPLIRDKNLKKVTCYSALMLIGLTVSLFVLFESKEVSIAALIEKIMKSVTKYMKV